MRYQSEANKKSLAEARKRMWNDPILIGKMRAGLEKGQKRSAELRKGQPANENQCNALAIGRKRNWDNPEYVAKMKKVSSETMAGTNRRRTSGEFPEWDANVRKASSETLQKRWRSGEQRKAMARRKDGFRSGLERYFADYLQACKIEYQYEPVIFDIVVDNKLRNYTPDFYIPSLNWWVEMKGFFWDEDSKRRVQIFSQQYPELKYSVFNSKLDTLLGPPWDGDIPWKRYTSTSNKSLTTQ